MVELGLVWVVLAGVYLVLAGSLNVNEVGAAVLCGGLGAIWVWQIGRCGDHHLAIRAASMPPLSVVLAVALAGYDLSRGHLPRALLKLGGATASPFRLLTWPIAGSSATTSPGSSSASPCSPAGSPWPEPAHESGPAPRRRSGPSGCGDEP
ncbi:hypothetical protein [Methylobacterium thuringiense]|uniref:Uncharacterized protein n=1 Tax=Methylobacterium thuringiense TaxID=1003091 RepID=A0ABQ4TTC7_9HYPH|nr:hypothetical protein [Methylobacterium thuringiense]GJE57135.1 hypothetical protein EKPJFOCH_3647 [Methylobacterium thuringiense]